MNFKTTFQGMDQKLQGQHLVRLLRMNHLHLLISTSPVAIEVDRPESLRRWNCTAGKTKSQHLHKKFNMNSTSISQP
jgi:hypothetical protein